MGLVATHVHRWLRDRMFIVRIYNCKYVAGYIIIIIIIIIDLWAVKLARK
jgi:hypothetical protein